MRTRLCALFILLTTLAGAQQKAPQEPRLTGFFTDMRYIAQTGDVLGTEVWIVLAREDYWVTFHDAQGAPEPPVVVAAKRLGDLKLQFTITTRLYPNSGPAVDHSILYEASVTPRGLLLSTPKIPRSKPSLLRRRF